MVKLPRVVLPVTRILFVPFTMANIVLPSLPCDVDGRDMFDIDAESIFDCFV